MTVTVGRLRPCNVLDWKFVLLSHNTVRGAAGATILNAEMLASLGKLESVAVAAGALERVEVESNQKQARVTPHSPWRRMRFGAPVRLLMGSFK